MKNPSLIKSNGYILDVEDFSFGLHQLIFICINNLTLQGLKEIKIADIETYLHNNDPKGYSLIFENEKNIEWIYNVYEDANELNFEYYYNTIRKMALLRNYMREGINVTCLLDLDEIDHVIIKQQQENFENMTLNDIQRYFDKKNSNAKQRFSSRDSNASRKSGDNAKELRQLMKESPCYGFGLESEYLNTITRGALPGKFFLETMDSGMGR